MSNQNELSRRDRTLADPEELASLLSNFARAIEEQGSPHATLVEIVRAAIELVPGCDEGSVTLIRGRHTVSSEAASGELPRLVDALQEKYQEGPCLDAALLHGTVRVSDMASESRWPTFTAAALDAGAAGMLCFPLYVEGDNFGALNLFSTEAFAFDEESEHVGLMLASHAAVAYSSARDHLLLTQRVRTQQLIGQAQGILMERHKMTGDQAFAVLVRASQQTNVKVRDLAERLVHSGVLGAPTRRVPSVGSSQE